MFYVFEIQPDKLQRFVSEVQKYDSMGGNKIERIDREGEKYLITFSREYSYPLILIELHEKFPQPKLNCE